MTLPRDFQFPAKPTAHQPRHWIVSRGISRHPGLVHKTITIVQMNKYKVRVTQIQINTTKGRRKSCNQALTFINSPPLHSWLFLANHILYEPISAILPVIYYLHWTNYELTRRFTKIKALEFGLNELIRLCLNTSKVLQGFTSNRTEIHWSRKVCEK